jgi:uncharacterized protein
MAAHSREPDAERARQVALDGCILRTVVGSTVHGLSNPGTDDRDELGVAVEPREYVLGLRRFEHWVFRTQPDGAPSGPGDLDLTVYGLRKFCRLAAKGSPTTLLPLFVRGEHVIACDELGAELQALAPAFVSRRAGRAFLGYATNQRRALLSGPQGVRARERSIRHGYDTKYAMHALRIVIQGRELLTGRTITLPVPEPERTRLREIRAGEPELDTVIADLDRAVLALQEATEAPGLPETADDEAIDRFLVSAYERAWAQRS